ncbi:MAG TPA: hypothetical protein VHB48_00740 [Chitinophagaceae bacterium]|nr:hypothetical protein [Chitinophagaceae bacterium]
MKKSLLLFAGLLTCNLLFAQTADELQKLAMQQAQAGQFDSAYHTLNTALQQKPGDIDLLKNQVLICVLKRDYENGLRIGQMLIQRQDADEQCYQVMGSVYNALAEYKDGEKMYREGLQKFPASGMLYSEYGNLLMQDGKPDDAIGAWEKGIQKDINNSSNYYYAAKYYATKNSLIWSLLYGEIFVNIESYTPRTKEIKQLLYNGYQKLFTGNALTDFNKNSKGFSKAMTDVLLKDATPLAADTIATLTSIRAKFIADWVNSGQAKTYPFRLFDLHRQLIENGGFTAYNEWLFGEAPGADKYTAWRQQHSAEADQWEQLLHNVVFKIPAGQYYAN